MNGSTAPAPRPAPLFERALDEAARHLERLGYRELDRPAAAATSSWRARTSSCSAACRASAASTRGPSGASRPPGKSCAVPAAAG